MATESRSQRQILVAFSAMMLATLLSALDQTIVATALPEIADDLHGLRGSQLGGDRLPALDDGHGPAVREAERPLRPPEPVRGLDLDLPARLGAVRARAVDGPADRLPGAAGDRRRRADPALAGRDRRPLLPARARPLPGLHGRGVGDRGGRRPAARRHAHRRRELALDLPHQPAAGRGRAGRRDPDDEDPAGAARALDRLRRRAGAERRRHRAPARRRLGRVELSVGLARGRRRGRRRRAGPRRVRA